MSQRVRTMQHGTVTAARRIGHGGAAEVWTVAERKDLVLKLYSTPPAPDDEAKMRDLIAAGLPVKVPGFPHLLAAWPRDIAFDGAGAMVGLLIPRAMGSVKFSVLAYLSEREKLAENLSYKLVLRWVHGACVLTSFAHHHDVVLCDANGRNFLGGGRGSTSLIDLDSVQFQGSGGRLWPSPWYSAEYLAPELHGADLRNVVRTPAHDDFAIFVLTFEVLFCGRGPFDAVYSDPDSTPSLRARNGQFAYSGTSADFRPPPMAPAWSIVGSELAGRFHQAFTAGAAGASGRPNVKELGDAIAATLAELVTCGGRRTHYYPQSAGQCPWCAYERGIGLSSATKPAAKKPWVRRSPAKSPGAPRTESVSPSKARAKRNPRHAAVTALVIVVLAALVLAIAGGGDGGSVGSSGSGGEPVASDEPLASSGSAPAGEASAEAEDASPHPTPRRTAASVPAKALRRHLRLLDRHRPMAAFRLFVPSYRAAVDTWVSIRRTARPRLRIVRVRAEGMGGGSARVRVLFYAKDTVRVTGSDRHCRRFWGIAHMRRIDGAWLYDPESGALESAVVAGARCS